MKRNALLILATAFAFVACRGGISEKPPIHLVPDMDHQQKLKAQSETLFDFPGWTDKRGMRPPVAGTVVRGSLATKELARFKDGDSFRANPLPLGKSVENVPAWTKDIVSVMERGRERFDIYCAVCHDRSGGGNGMVIQRAPTGSFNPQIPDLGADPRLKGQSDGELCQTITNGLGTMPAYGHMIPPADRWAIVHYLRALQNRIKE